jgi:acetyl-CoA C-acetyltransferase
VALTRYGEPVRTPICPYCGALKLLSAAELGEIEMRGQPDRTGLNRNAIDDVVVGHCYPAAIFERAAA